MIFILIMLAIMEYWCIMQIIYLKDPNKLLENGWEDVTPECIRKNTNSRILYYDPKTGTKVRFDLKAEEVPGYNGKDHYHIYNPDLLW